MTAARDIDRAVKRVGDVVTVAPTDTARLAAEKMRTHKVGSLVVQEGGARVVGILTERDIISQVVAASADPAHTAVSEIMTRDVVSCAADTPLAAAQELMVRRGVRHLPIIENGELRGMISSRDLVAHQLAVTKAMKAAAEQVAAMSKALKPLDIDDVADMAMSELPKLFGAEWASLYLVGGDRGTDHELPFRRRGCPCSPQDMQDRWRAMSLDGAAHTTCSDIPAACKSGGAAPPCVVLPVDLADGPSPQDEDGLRAGGYACMCRLDSASEESTEFIEYKGTLAAGIVGAHIRNALAHQKAYLNTLTGLYVRRVFEERLKTEYARSVRHGHPFSISFIDIDRFKEINDRFGDAAGDRVLQDLAKLMRREVRSADLLCRFGGDEFVCLMPETDLDGAAVVVKRVRSRVEALSVLADCTVTISAGVATWSGEAEDSGTAVLRRAEASLHQAKAIGRNCVVTASGDRRRETAAQK